MAAPLADFGHAFMLPTLGHERDHKHSRDGETCPGESVRNIGSDAPS